MRHQQVLLLLLCNWKQCELHGPKGPLTIGRFRINTICEELRSIFGNGKGRQEMSIVLANASEMGMKRKLLEALKEDKKLMEAVMARERKLDLPQIFLA